jgi:uncharacterized membrane protein YfcA
MSLVLIVALMFLGTLGGFAAGLLGFGGGVLMFPLLLYVPPLIGLAAIDAKAVAAIVASQVFFSTLAGGLAHLRRGRVQGQIAMIAGIVSAVGSLTGSVASKWASDRFLLILFGAVTLLVIGIMLLAAPRDDQEETSADRVTVPRVALSVYSFLTGVVIGFLGAGNFVFVPVLIYLLHVPTRIAIGSSLFIAMMNTAAGFLGKWVTGQIPLLATVMVVAGAIIGALAGEKVHRRLSSALLRQVYAVLVALIALRVWLTILGLDA